MSEQILRNPKSTNRTGGYVSGKYDINKQNASQMGLTKVKNPLTNRFTSKQENKVSFIDKGIDHNAKKGLIEQIQSKENRNKNVQSSLLKQKSLQQLQYKFYADRFNVSSDDSFMFDSSMRKSRKQKREQQIVERFQNSRKQIQQLLKRSRERREQCSDSIKCRNQEPIMEAKNQAKKIDRKQEKRRKLKFYHCDSIIIKPEFQPTKVYQLSITPTTHNQNPTKFSFFPNHHSNEPLQQSINSFVQQNSKYESVRKSKSKRFLDSFSESPLEQLKDSKHHFQLQSSSFLDQNKDRYQNNYEDLSFVKENSHEKKKIFLKKIDQHDENDNDGFQNKASRSISEQQEKLNARKCFEKSPQQTVSTHSFKKRNKIFTNDKKSGLKLSRTIRYEEEINKLKSEMGVDVFHIVIQEEEFFRQCCT